MSGKETWSEETKADLKRLFDQGLSFGQIGAQIGISRNAAIGKARRLGLTRIIIETRSAAPLPPRPPRRERKPRANRGWISEAERVKRVTEPSKPQAALPPTPIEDDAIPVEQRLTIFDLTNKTCRWPVGDPGTPDFFFCGDPSADCDRGRPYCPAHAAVAFNGKPLRGAPFIPRRAA